jgi:hypothetical protein
VIDGRGRLHGIRGPRLRCSGVMLVAVGSFRFVVSELSVCWQLCVVRVGVLIGRVMGRVSMVFRNWEVGIRVCILLGEGRQGSKGKVPELYASFLEGRGRCVQHPHAMWYRSRGRLLVLFLLFSSSWDRQHLPYLNLTSRCFIPPALLPSLHSLQTTPCQVRLCF